MFEELLHKYRVGELIAAIVKLKFLKTLVKVQASNLYSETDHSWDAIKLVFRERVENGKNVLLFFYLWFFR